MSVMERTTYRRSLGSNALAFDEPRRDPQHAPYTSGPSTDFSVDDSIPLFLSNLQDRSDPREFAPLAAGQWTSVLTRVVAGGLVVSAFAILVAVAARQIPLKDDPAVLGVRDTRSITPDPVMARDWYRKAASFGSADAQQRLTQLQN